MDRKVMKKIVAVFAFCTLSLTATAKYEELYDMAEPVIKKSAEAKIWQYQDKGGQNYCYILEMPSALVTAECFREALGHYKNKGAQVIAHDSVASSEVVTLRIEGRTIQIIRQRRKLIQIFLDARSENYKNFKNYLRANNLLPSPLDLVAETQELSADLSDAEVFFNGKF